MSAACERQREDGSEGADRQQEKVVIEAPFHLKSAATAAVVVVLLVMVMVAAAAASSQLQACIRKEGAIGERESEEWTREGERNGEQERQAKRRGERGKR